MLHVPYTYLIGWSKLNLWYYGVEYANSKTKTANPSNLWKTYFTSSKLVQSHRKKHGEPDVIQVRKTFGNAKSAVLWEQKVLSRLNAATSSKWLNQCHNAPNFVLNFHQETIEKIRAATIMQFATPESRAKHSELTKLAMTDEVKRKISDKGKGREPWNKGTEGLYSEEHIQKLKENHWMKDGSRNHEHIANLAEINRNREYSKHTDETKAKVSKSRKGKALGNQNAKGHKWTDEQRAKLKSRVPWNKGISTKTC